MRYGGRKRTLTAVPGFWGVMLISNRLLSTPIAQKADSNPSRSATTKNTTLACNSIEKKPANFAAGRSPKGKPASTMWAALILEKHSKRAQLFFKNTIIGIAMFPLLLHLTNPDTRERHMIRGQVKSEQNQAPTTDELYRDSKVDDRRCGGDAGLQIPRSRPFPPILSPSPNRWQLMIECCACFRVQNCQHSKRLCSESQ